MFNLRLSLRQQSYWSREEKCMKCTKPSKYKKNSLKSINLINKTLIKFQSEGRRYKEARSLDTDTFDKFLSVLTIK